MESSQQENTRAQFTSFEKEFLKDLVMRNRALVENSQTDKVLQKNKKKAWEQMTREFNSVASHTPRNVKQLKKAWDNMKTRRKLAQAKERRERMKTGGGPPPQLPVGNIDDPIDGFIDNVVVNEVQGAMDSDTIRMEARPSKDRFDGFICPEPSSNLTEEISNDDSDFDLYQPDPLLVQFEDPVPDQQEQQQQGEQQQQAEQLQQPGPQQRDRTGYSRLRRNVALRSEVDARVMRVRRQMQFDDDLNTLIMREQHNKVAISDFQRRTAEVELKLKEEELEFKRRKWNLELEKLQSQ